MKAAVISLPFAIAAYGSVSVSGAGSTFVAPIATQWCHRFQSANPDVHITYDSVGSGEGIGRAIEGSVDFGATDGPMTKVEMESYRAQHQSEVFTSLRIPMT